MAHWRTPKEILAGLLVACLVLPAIAQTPLPQPDRHGDYYSNDAPAKGTVPVDSKLSPGSLWRVVSQGLNCRRSPAQRTAITRQFQRGDILQVEVYRGGSDEVLLNAKDASGKPWMPVRGKNSNQVCYVRANNRYIQPLKRP